MCCFYEWLSHALWYWDASSFALLLHPVTWVSLWSERLSIRFIHLFLLRTFPFLLCCSQKGSCLFIVVFLAFCPLFSFRLACIFLSMSPFKTKEPVMLVWNYSISSDENNTILSQPDPLTSYQLMILAKLNHSSDNSSFFHNRRSRKQAKSLESQSSICKETCDQSDRLTNPWAEYWLRLKRCNLSRLCNRPLILSPSLVEKPGGEKVKLSLWSDWAPAAISRRIPTMPCLGLWRRVSVRTGLAASCRIECRRCFPAEMPWVPLVWLLFIWLKTSGSTS